MKSMIKTLGLGIILFGLSATVSYFLLTPSAKPTEVAEETKDEIKPTDAASDPVSQEAFKLSPMAEEKSEDAKPQTQVPVAFTAEKGITVEAVMEMAKSVRRTEMMLNERSALIDKNEERTKLIFSDLDRERSELDAFAKTVDEKIQVAQELLQTIKTERAALLAEKQEMASMKKTAPGSNAEAAPNAMSERLKKVKTWFKDIEPETAARYVKEFANGGELEFASQLMMQLDQSTASEILTKLDDPILARQLISEAMKDGTSK